MNLSDIFTAVAHKELVAVDLLDAGSNQHEFNGVTALKEVFGTAEKTHGKITWHYFADDQDPEQEEQKFTFYDARARSASRTGRSEWRFYYYGSFLSRASTGDLFVLVRSKAGRYYGLIFEKNSAWRRAARELFNLADLGSTFDAIPRQKLDSQRLEFLRQQILGELELDFALPVPATDEQLMLQKFGKIFPSTREMSAFARTQTDVDFGRPDEALTRWLEREEQLFRALENVVIRERLERRFATVDEFVEYSLSVQNRRKSRMGFALQNHLGEIFVRHQLRFTAQAKTEGNNKPDFIFPGQQEYHDEKFDRSLLVMLGVKSTSKDRWRQVLTEADYIKRKHLCTLEAGISIRQTEEMQRQNLSLVVPSSLHPTYTSAQLKEIMSLADFIGFVSRKQNK